MNSQIAILKAISDVRNELKPDMNNIEAAEVLARLASLYALLDVESLRIVLTQQNFSKAA